LSGRYVKQPNCRTKINPVLLEIALPFGFVPLEFHGASEQIIFDGLARTQWHRLLKKFGCSERRRLNEKGVSNGLETPEID